MFFPGSGGVGTLIIFDGVCSPTSETPTYLRIFLPQKMADLMVFSKFLQIGTISCDMSDVPTFNYM